MLRERGDVGHGRAQGPANLKNSRGGWIAPTEHRDAGARAERLLDVAALEDHAALREGVEVRRFHGGVAEATKLRTHVVEGNEQNVGTVRGDGRMGEDERRKQQEEFHGVGLRWMNHRDRHAPGRAHPNRRAVHGRERGHHEVARWPDSERLCADGKKNATSGGRWPTPGPAFWAGASPAGGSNRLTSRSAVGQRLWKCH